MKYIRGDFSARKALAKSLGKYRLRVPGLLIPDEYGKDLPPWPMEKARAQAALNRERRRRAERKGRTHVDRA